jgi:hypothetical protein
MITSRRIWLAVAVVLSAIAGIIWFASHRGAGVAEKYKAELRAKGEKLSFAELGFPRQPENEAGLARLTNAVAQIQPGGFFPGLLSPMHFVGPGRAQVSWRSSEVVPTNNGGGTTNETSWEELNKHLADAADQLAEIRSAVEQPMRWFLYDPASYLKNMPNGPWQPFLPMRTAAQWLSADAIGALHAAERDRALKDLHALVQLTEFGKEDSMLVAQMIRVAISGLGLSVTWEALQDANWAEPELAAMQRDWERVDLLKALETGFLGARAFGEAGFADIRENGAQWGIQRMLRQQSTPSGMESLENTLVAFAWKMSAQEDELMVFRSYQTALDSMRDLQKDKSWLEVQARQQRLIAEIDKLVGESMGLRKYQFLFSAAIIPNVLKASQTVVKNETQRRLTVVAIALKRFELVHHRLPASLPELAPEFLAAVSIDPMSGQPLRYRLNADGSFVLYSVGEDGRDDGGDPNPPQPVSQFDLWSARDAVWPMPAVAPKRANN